MSLDLGIPLPLQIQGSLVPDEATFKPGFRVVKHGTLHHIP